MTSLEEKIKNRRQEAVDHCTMERASRIASVLGEHSASHKYEDHATVDHDASIFQNSEFKISSIFNSESCDDGGGYYSYRARVDYKDKTVFETVGDRAEDITTYLPGAWEKSFNALDQQAQGQRLKDQKKAAIAQRKEKRAEAARKAKDVRDHFGV